MRSISVFALVFLAGFALAAYAQNPGTNASTGQPMGAPPAPDTSRVQMEMAHGQPAAGPLVVTFGSKHAEWTPQSLASLPHVTINVYNEHAKANQTYSGVPLIELLKPLGVSEKPHGKDLRLYLIAEGSDGYQVVYSIAEVTPDVHDASILAADSMDGKPMGDNGPLQLVATGEKRPARWVRNLVAIHVMTAP